MKPFVKETGQAVDLPRDNIDTDQLIPARFMSRSRSEGYGDYLFHDLRRDPDGALDPAFPLNGAADRPFLIVGENFGCGSSREAAVYALQDGGIRAVIARGFADIFRSNAMKNGLLPVQLPPEEHMRLRGLLEEDPDLTLEVDLETCRVVAAGEHAFDFQIEAAAQRKLLKGLDEIAETLEQEGDIAGFTQRHRQRFPWVFVRAA